jgi:biopolymer transport protein ExbB/TolQ
MALDGVMSGSIDSVTELISKVGDMMLLLQTLGVILVLWIIFQSIALWLNFRRMKAIGEIRKDMDRIEKKIDYIKRK